MKDYEKSIVEYYGQVDLADNIMAALPGTTRLYQTVGFDITDRRIDFGEVSYRWNVANGKPKVEDQGQIHRRSFIGVRHQRRVESDFDDCFLGWTGQQNPAIEFHLTVYQRGGLGQAGQTE